MNRMITRHNQEEQELKQSADNELSELQQLQVRTYQANVESQ